MKFVSGIYLQASLTFSNGPERRTKHNEVMGGKDKYFKAPKVKLGLETKGNYQRSIYSGSYSLGTELSIGGGKTGREDMMLTKHRND